MNKNKTYFDICHKLCNMQQLSDVHFHFRSQSCDRFRYKFAKTLATGNNNVRNKHGTSVNTFTIIFLSSRQLLPTNKVYVLADKLAYYLATQG